MTLTSNETSYIMQKSQIGSDLVYVKLLLVIAARAGFVLTQSGSIPTEQFYDLLLQNIVEFSISSTAFGLFGSLLSFGENTIKGTIAYGDYSTLSMDYVAFGYSTVIFGSAIITTALSSRLHFFAYTIIALVYSGITEPILLHWIYSPNGWLKQATFFNNTATLHDFGGGLTLNLTSGLISIIGLGFLGRRLLKLHDIDEYSIGSESPVVVTLGYFLVLMGYVANFTLVPLMEENRPFLMLNVILAMGGGGVASVMIELFVKKPNFNFWLITRLLQGTLIGLTFTASIIDLCYPPIIFGASLIGGSILSLSSKMLFKLAVQDYCNVIPIFFLPGIWSPIIRVILSATDSSCKTTGGTFVNFLWHCCCSLIICSYTASIFAILFLLLRNCGFLRNECERNSHLRSLKLLKYTNQCPLHHLIDTTDEDDILEPGVSGKTPNENIHRLQQSTNLKHFRVKYPEEKIPKSSIPNQKDLGGVNKNIYTLQKLVRSAGSNHPLSSGDRKDLVAHCKTVNEGKSDRTRVQNKIKKKKSHHQLAKSSRFVDFRRKKKIKSNWKKDAAIIPGKDNECSHGDFDAKYNDGFVTIKLPNKKSHCSSD